jgi:hypothetical protein
LAGAFFADAFLARALFAAALVDAVVADAFFFAAAMVSVRPPGECERRTLAAG